MFKETSVRYLGAESFGRKAFSTRDSTVGGPRLRARAGLGENSTSHMHNMI